MARDTFEGIPLEGPSSFLAVTVQALKLIQPTAFWKYPKALSLIRRGKTASGAAAHCGLPSRECVVGHDIADIAYLAAIYVHEGAHAVHGIYERPAWQAQYRFLKTIGEHARAKRLWDSAQDPGVYEFYDKDYADQGMANPNRGATASLPTEARQQRQRSVVVVHKAPEWVKEGSSSSVRTVTGGARITITRR